MKILIHTFSIALFALLLSGCALQDQELAERHSSTVIGFETDQIQTEETCNTPGIVRVTKGTTSLRLRHSAE